jgi:hypothetical protein
MSRVCRLVNMAPVSTNTHSQFVYKPLAQQAWITRSDDTCQQVCGRSV